jgi:hypothetical protein
VLDHEGRSKLDYFRHELVPVWVENNKYREIFAPFPQGADKMRVMDKILLKEARLSAWSGIEATTCSFSAGC